MQITRKRSVAPSSRSEALKDFQKIPGVGRSIANDLWNMGFRSASELRGKDPEVLYDNFQELVGGKVDRCMLYVFRCAVYYVSTPKPDPKKLQWWYWKDRKSLRA